MADTTTTTTTTTTLEDFNQPSIERAILLERLQEEKNGGTPHFWAACQVCNIDCLRELSDYPIWVLSALDCNTSQMVRHWASTPGGPQSRSTTPKQQTPLASPLNPNTSPSMQPPSAKRQKLTDSPTTLLRDKNIRKQAEERDNSCCVLTGVKMVEVAHIYPYHSIKRREQDSISPRHTFWYQLATFWSREKVASWEAKLFPNGIVEKGQEQVYNMISLSPTVHAFWGRGLFALKPVSESADGKSLKVQFFWQQKQTGFSPINFTTTPVSTQGLEETAGVWLHTKDGRRITSGDIFKLTTDDPISKPLPSFELLELQWFLHRIQGMAGAADEEWATRWGGSDSDLSDMDVPELDLDEEPSSP